jgi:hypothetical protein
VTLARRTPLRAKKPLERKSPLRPKAASQREARPSKLPVWNRTYEGPPRDEAFLAYVRRWPCVHCRLPAPSDPHHFEKHAKGQKCSDYDTIPLCRLHHDHWHDRCGTLPRIPRPGRADVSALDREACLIRFRRVSRRIRAAYERKKAQP